MRESGAPGYWIVVAVLCLFGFVGIFSVGMPFLLLGITLAVVAPWRRQRAVLWPAVTAVVGFVVGYVLVAPLSCSTSATSADPQLLLNPVPPARTTSCTNLLGIGYSGSGSYGPSLWPAVLCALALSVAAAATVRVSLTRPRRAASS